MSVEDEHFYSDPVLNEFDGVARAAVAMLRTTSDPGGSPFPSSWPNSSTGVARVSARPWRRSGWAQASVRVLHDQVLVMYLNAVYYGNGYWGDVAASRLLRDISISTRLG